MDIDGYDHVNEYIEKTEIEPRIRELISHFSILWNEYEGKIYANAYGAGELNKKIHLLYKPVSLECFGFSSNLENLYARLKKYINRRGVTFNSSSLKSFFNINAVIIKNGQEHKRNDIGEKELEDIIQRENSLDKLHFLLLICARVRNNMFHGTKELKEVNEQGELFKICNETLLMALDLFVLSSVSSVSINNQGGE